MPYCPKCSSLADEKDTFCTKCGTNLNSQSPNKETGLFNFSFPPKPTTNLINGVIIGSGLTLIIVGLSVGFALNSIYWGQMNILNSQGLKTNAINFSLSNIVEWISLCGSFVIFGVYFLVIGIIEQFNSSVRSAMESKKPIARLGNGLISGGFVLVALSAAEVIRELYIPNLSSFEFLYHVFVLSGLLIVAIGALLKAASYLKRRNLATKL
jgi:magnesium-transporting ATPase (P-type)